MKIAFLLDNAYGIGGTIRATVNLSRALAARHSVEVVSLRRTAAAPALPFDSRVRLSSLIDLRRDSPRYDGEDPRFHERSERFTEGVDHFERGIATRLGDERVREWLRGTEADVVIATRPKLNDYLAAYGEQRYVRIGQEHLTHAMHNDHVRGHQDAAVPHLDAFITVSYADAAQYRAAIPEADASGTLITCVPNSVPATAVESSHGDSKLIVAAGRLVKVKRYDRLLAAFALVADDHPEWRLRLYGRGRQQAALRARVDELGLYDRVSLMGPHAPIETEWAKGAIAAVSSDAESFGMTLVEAMHCGVPVISTDCPYGPGEIVGHGQDGLLTPLGEDEERNVRAYADALAQLMDNPGLRHRMGQAAQHKAKRYAPKRIAAEYEQLIDKLLEERRGAAAPGITGAAGAPAAAEPAESAPKEAPPRGDSLPGMMRRVLRRGVRRLAGPLLRPLRQALRGLRAQRGRHDRRTEAAAQPPAMRRPRARVRVTADGSLAVRLRAGRLPRGGASLVLRPRRREAGAEVRVPLPPLTEAAGGWLEVRLEHAGHRLAEARWDTYVERALDGRRSRVRAELVETARLLTLPAPVGEDGEVHPWVPYTTTDGYLAVRAWRRAGHAEVTSVALGSRGFGVRARLYGRAARTGAWEGGTVVAAPRGEGPHAFELPLHAPESGGTVSFELPYDLPATLGTDRAPGSGSGSGSGSGEDEGAVWDLWLRAADGDTVRLARLLGDLADRKKTDVVPTARLADSPRGVRLYFSLNNDLALHLTPPRETPEPPSAAEPETESPWETEYAQDTEPGTGERSEPTGRRSAQDA
ncbi:glycosyltransferase [Streptomyces sp. HNM0574]|uniref:glycosyltransferase n=1 Tax=Streptomyces sp. HNM0574 TaxID=2714954 RepID=UPI00146B4E30|nr:glycosyltransferase [Streptomyces sp. HNM0574]NLU67384.1 glycosyltransferase family 4 protein [Streptomyces sp. HNM0574]